MAKRMDWSKARRLSSRADTAREPTGAATLDVHYSNYIRFMLAKGLKPRPFEAWNATRLKRKQPVSIHVVPALRP